MTSLILAKWTHMEHNSFILKTTYFNGPQPTQLKLDAGRLNIERGRGIRDEDTMAGSGINFLL